MITENKTYRAGVSPKFLDAVVNFFGRNYANIGYELIQNSWRAGSQANSVAFNTYEVGGESDEVVLKIGDTGAGTDLRYLLQAGESEWSDDVKSEHPAGMGMFSLVGLLESASIVITSVTKTADKPHNTRYTTDVLKREHFTGKEELNISEEVSEDSCGTIIRITGRYDDRSFVGACKSIITAMAAATSRRHVRYFSAEPNCNYLDVDINVDAVVRTRLKDAGAYVSLDDETPSIDYDIIDLSGYGVTIPGGVRPAIDVVKFNRKSNIEEDVYDIQSQALVVNQLEDGRWSHKLVHVQSIVGCESNPLTSGNNGLFNFIFHGKCVNLGSRHADLVDDLKSFGVGYFTDRKNSKLYYLDSEGVKSDDVNLRPGQDTAVFVNDASYLRMTHPERDTFVACKSNDEIIDKLLAAIYDQAMDCFEGSYKEKHPDRLKLIYRNLRDPYKLAEFDLLQRVSSIDAGGGYSAPNMKSVVVLDLPKGSEIEAVDTDKLGTLLDLELISENCSVVRADGNDFVELTKVVAKGLGLKLNQYTAAYPLAKSLAFRKTFEYSYEGAFQEVEVHVMNEPTLRIHRTTTGDDGSLNNLTINEPWGEPLAFDSDVDLPDIIYSEDNLEASTSKSIEEDWLDVYSYSGERHMTVVMSKEQAYNCLGVYDEDNLFRLSYRDYVDEIPGEPSPEAFVARMAADLQIMAGFKPVVDDNLLATALEGEVFKADELINSMRAMNHPGLQKGEVTCFHATLKVTSDGFEIVEAAVKDSE